MQFSLKNKILHHLNIKPFKNDIWIHIASYHEKKHNKRLNTSNSLLTYYNTGKWLTLVVDLDETLGH